MEEGEIHNEFYFDTRDCDADRRPPRRSHLVKRRAPDTVGNVAADVLDNAHENFMRRRGKVTGVVVLEGVNPAEEQIVEAVCGREGMWRVSGRRWRAALAWLK